jgi:UDP-N-acetylglucosamine 2-epimerase (non-hydrolysing)
MTNRLKVMTVVGTRPEIIRLARVMNALDNSKAIDHVIVHTGQNYDYELNQIFFDDLQIRKPDFFLNAAGASATETIGKILINIDFFHFYYIISRKLLKNTQTINLRIIEKT